MIYLNVENNMNSNEYDGEYGDSVYDDLLEYRRSNGWGCSCHINPPCCFCSNPMTISEAEALGLIKENNNEEKNKEE